MASRRFDSGTLDGPEMTPEGYLRCWASIARTGVQTYKRRDGSKTVEYRSPEEVGRVDSLASFGGKVVTLEHPPEPLNSENTHKYKIGFTDSEVVFDGKWVRVRLTVTDKDAIKDVLSGYRSQVSPGYQTVLVNDGGVSPEGENYDVAQTNILGNHLALTVKARAGPEASIHLDSDDAIAVIDSETQTFDSTPMAKITISGAEYEVSEAVAVAYTTAQRNDSQATETSISTLTSEKADLQAKLDTAEGTAAAQKTRLDSLAAELETVKAERLDSDAVEALVEARVALRAKAEVHLDSEFDFAGKSERDIKVAVIHSLRNDSADLSDKSADYIDACFETLVELSEKQDSNDSLREGVRASLRSDAADEGAPSKARTSYVERLNSAWKAAPSSPSK